MGGGGPYCGSFAALRNRSMQTAQPGKQKSRLAPAFPNFRLYMTQ